MDNKRKIQTILSALARIIVYIVLVSSPLVLKRVLRIESIDDNFTREVSRNFALLAVAILSMQFVVSARFKWVERPFGLDKVFRFHKAMGLLAAALLFVHPILLAAGKSWSLLLDTRWHILLGKLGLIVLLLLGFAGIFRLAIKLDFERWRFGHNLSAALVLLLGFLHSWYAGSDLHASAAMRFWWIGMLGVAALAYVYHRVLRPAWYRRRAYHVIEVLQETHDVWTIKLSSPEGGRRYDYLPGQFHFIKLYRGSGLPVEEHPFTISSSPAEENFVSSTIKESGDFTATIGQTKPGDTAIVQGPYGRFSYVLHPEEKELVFIAGGVGITPLMSMLRYMRDTRTDKDVLLLYGNKTENDIIFRGELSEIEAGGYPHLKVAHILSQAGNEWRGETGFVDKEKIERLCGGGLETKAFYVCGPSIMMDNVIRTLRTLGIPSGRIHHERFSL